MPILSAMLPQAERAAGAYLELERLYAVHSLILKLGYVHR